MLQATPGCLKIWNPEIPWFFNLSSYDITIAIHPGFLRMFKADLLTTKTHKRMPRRRAARRTARCHRPWGAENTSRTWHQVSLSRTIKIWELNIKMTSK